MSFMNEVNPYAKGTRDCMFNYSGCEYYKDGRCVYNIHPIRIEISKACYDEIMQDRIECELDYDMGLII